MKSDKYTEAALNLSKAADIAIESFKKYPPKKWDQENFNQTINFYIECKVRITQPESRYRNLKSLKYQYEDVFTYYQEGRGEAVEEFWRGIKEEGLPYKRENKLVKILKRKKINNAIEFDFVTDVIVPYQQEGLITEEEVVLLNTYLGKFEEKQRK